MLLGSILTVVLLLSGLYDCQSSIHSHTTKHNWDLPD
jgi:hypothetical protein